MFLSNVKTRSIDCQIFWNFLNSSKNTNFNNSELHYLNIHSHLINLFVESEYKFYYNLLKIFKNSAMF